MHLHWNNVARAVTTTLATHRLESKLTSKHTCLGTPLCRLVEVGLASILPSTPVVHLCAVWGGHGVQYKEERTLAMLGEVGPLPYCKGRHLILPQAHPLGQVEAARPVAPRLQ